MDTAAFRRSVIDELGDDLRLFRAPGRVNLIGEHTDYNDGFVLPVAINREVMMAARPTGGRRVTIRSRDFAASSNFSLDEIGYDSEQTWSNYPRGVCYVLEGADFHLTGADIVFAGDVPIGSGLSSSAALQVATAITFLSLAEYDVPGEAVARFCQQSEHEFVGNRCGIMDQFISALGEAGHALLIDCRSLAHRAIPLPRGVTLVVGDTRVRRQLVDSEYNTRRAQCEEGVRLLRAVLPEVRALRDLTPEALEANAVVLPEEIYRRCRHVVTENARVLDAVAAMESGDLATLGLALNASHVSLRDDYGVSCRELDLMVEFAQRQPGVYGARMTGAGFGGCTISLVADAHVEAFVADVGSAYHAATGITPQLYICSASAGAGEIAT